MKKHGILNSEISKVLSDLGHKDRICIADAGLPIPKGVKRIDLSLKKGLPSFKEVLEVVLTDMWVEQVIVAKEITKRNPKVIEDIVKLIGSTPIQYETHEDFKKLTTDCVVVIRTGEMTPYANIILQSNVHFD
jgi:D-ribose pyranase